MLLNDLLDSEFLKIDVNCQNLDTVKFLDEGVKEDSSFGGKRLVVRVEVLRGGEFVCQKKFSPNKSNLKEVVATYGADNKEWIGKEMVINRVVVRNPSTGKMVPSVVLTAPVGTVLNKAVQ